MLPLPPLPEEVMLDTGHIVKIIVRLFKWKKKGNNKRVQYWLVSLGFRSKFESTWRHLMSEQLILNSSSFYDSVGLLFVLLL